MQSTSHRSNKLALGACREAEMQALLYCHTNQRKPEPQPQSYLQAVRLQSSSMQDRIDVCTLASLYEQVEVPIDRTFVFVWVVVVVE